MSAVIHLPCSPRVLNAVRGAINERAKAHSVPEGRRLQAIGRALRLLADGSSSAWATQAALQTLREPSRIPVGGDAA